MMKQITQKEKQMSQWYERNQPFTFRVWNGREFTDECSIVMGAEGAEASRFLARCALLLRFAARHVADDLLGMPNRGFRFAAMRLRSTHGWGPVGANAAPLPPTAGPVAANAAPFSC